MADGTRAGLRPAAVRRLALRYRISALLVALALVPLTGVGWFAVAELHRADAARVRADAVDTQVARLILLIELKAQLQDERNWSSASWVTSQIGLDDDVVMSLTGFNIPAQQERSATRVDELISQLRLEDLAPRVARVRAEVPGEGAALFTASSGYEIISQEIAAEAQGITDELRRTAGRMEGGTDLVTTLRVLEASTVTQEAASLEFTAFFSAQFADRELLTDLIAVVGLRAVRVGAEADIRRAVNPGSRSAGAMDALDSSDDARIFDHAVASLVERALASPDEVKNESITTFSAGLSQLTRDFRAGQATMERYFELVDAAGHDTLDASASVQGTAERQFDRAAATAVALMVVSLLFAAAATRAVVRPMRRLAEVARRISDGDSSARFGAAGGSVEIRDAGRAMDAAAAHLELAEQQAKALADGDLDHPVLARASTGLLGASLQVAVEALASSMQEREEFRRRMTHEATHDGLTQIANRNACLAQLRRGLARVNRSETLLAVLFIDLDGFKDINDTHGHQTGDLVLRAVAQRLVNTVRDGDHVGRLGGDEFLVIAEPVGGLGEAVELAHRLLESLVEPLPIEQGVVSVAASIGIAISAGNDEADSVDLLRDADLAVYKAKADGRGRVVICDDELRAALFERADIERALRRAIDELEFVLYYQPIIASADRTLRGFEALIRWNRPGHGMISPDTFIPVAERSDLIIAIDQWVVGAVVRQLAQWEAEGRFKGLPVSVNISGRHLGSPSLIGDVLSPLRDHEVDPSRIVVEITESALLEDLEGAAAKLQVLRNSGIRIAIDDFGTGYTSLAHLKSLPIDVLKIDRSYTSDGSAASLVQLIIDTGHLLGATITAEGIETPEQAAALSAMGTDELQGYLFGHPRPPAEVVVPEPLDRLPRR